MQIEIFDIYLVLCFIKERAIKGFHACFLFVFPQDTVSVHRPGFYAERFMNFMTKTVFKKIPSRKLYTISFCLYYLFKYLIRT